jgi:catechol 2,3-dioxygenase-like lactoylglutathione lyase family enzyme
LLNIIGVESITYGVTDLEKCSRYLGDWGLHPISHDIAGAVFETLEKTTVQLRKADDSALPPLHCDTAFFKGSCGREVIWGVDNATTLAAIGAELSKDRDVSEAPDGSLHSIDDANNPLGFCITQRKVAKLTHPAINSPGNPTRINESAYGAAASLASPARIGHVVYSVADDVEQKAAFYLDRLGFKLSDKIGKGGCFMRPAGSQDHHNLLVQSHGGGYGMQHAAYEFRDFDQVMQRGLHMEEQGWQTHIGPTRHTLGSNYSWYMWTPLGGLMELISDMDVLDDNWEPRHVDPATAGPPHSWYARPEQKNRKFGQPHD